MRFSKLCKSAPLALAVLAAAAPISAQPSQPAPQPASPAPVAPALADPSALRGSIQVCEAARGEHRIRLEQGKRYHISATSETFDPFLRLLPAGGQEALAEDDDSGGGVTPRITYVPERSGEYVVQVSSFAPGGVGDYALSVTPAGPLPALITRPTRTEAGRWQIFQGDLGAADAVELGRRYDDYELRLAAGESAMIHVEANNSDTLLQVFKANERGAQPLIENDDGGGGNNPFIFFSPEAAGTYVVRVIGFDEQAAGAYRLRISR